MQDVLDRRGFMTGAGMAVAAAAASRAVGGAGRALADEGAAEAAETTKYAEFEDTFRTYLRLDTHMIGVKFYESADDVPAEAVRPVRDLGKHIALCQAFALARFRGETYCMTVEDHWCWGPLVGLGLVDADPGTEAFDVVCQYMGIADADATVEHFTNYPRLEKGKYEALVVAPLSTMTFDPDVILVYGTPFQINYCCLCAKNTRPGTFTTEIDGIDSCVYELVGVMRDNDYKVCLPDPGEVVRARTDMTEVTFAMPGSKFDDFVEGYKGYGSMMGFDSFKAQYEVAMDFERPPFYNTIFGLWGLEQGDDWSFGTDAGADDL